MSLRHKYDLESGDEPISRSPRQSLSQTQVEDFMLYAVKMFTSHAKHLLVV